MSQNGNRKIIFVAGAAVIVVAAVLLFMWFLRGGETYRSIKVIELEGSVDVERGAGESMTAAVNMNLVSGDRVTTGEQSYVVLQLDTDKYVMLGENGAMQVAAEGDETKGQISIQLESGSVLSEIQNPLPEGASYNINTPNATMSVRGTVFEVRKNPQETTIDVLVYDGSVAVGLDGQDPVLYGEGEYTTFEDKDNPQFLIEHSEITDDVMNKLVAQRLEKISAEGRNINAGQADISKISKQQTEIKGERKEETETEEAAEPEVQASEEQSTEARNTEKKGTTAKKAEKEGTKEAADSETVPSETSDHVASNNDDDTGSYEKPQTQTSPADTEKPDNNNSKDTETPDNKKPKDTEKPDNNDSKDTEKPDNNNSKDTETPDNGNPQDTQAPVTENTETPAAENTPVTETPVSETPITETPVTENTETSATEAPSDTEKPGGSSSSWLNFEVVYYLPYIAPTVADAQTGEQTAQVQYQWKQWYANNYNVNIGSLLTEPANKPESKNSPGWNGAAAPEGLTFAGWYMKGSSTVWNFAMDRVTINRELYASWKDEFDGKIYYPVVFEEVYTNTAYVNCIKEGSTVHVVPEKTGCKFCYWRTSDGVQWDGIVDGPTYLTPVWEKE